MAKFAPVAPIQILEEMKKEGCLGSYHLLLAHHVIEFPDRFRALFADLRNCTIIMDNSIIELGASQNETVVAEAVNVVKSVCNWVIPVLTDVMGDGPKTRIAAAESYDTWKGLTNDPLMVVLQGNNWEDFCKTADTFLLDPKYSQITYVGIPRVLVGKLGTRQLAVQYVDAIRPDINIHLLGFSDDVTDDVICSNSPAVMGIDSAVPIRYTHHLPEGVSPIYTPTADIPPRSPTWFEDGQYTDDVFTNLYNIRKWVA